MHARGMTLLAGWMLTASAATGALWPSESQSEVAGPPPRRFAVPSDTGHYVGYYVGGGNAWPHRAEPRHPDEGTWGWDYQGWLIPRRIIAGWWHGRKDQGGPGSYRSDGPHLYHESEQGR